MASILAVGIATLDIINIVAHYPNEDSEVRTAMQRQQRGGNATNTLAVLSQLSHQCHWAGVLVDTPSHALIQQDLADYQINTSACWRQQQGSMPTSYITLVQSSGSRTIVHHRDCPEYDFAHFRQLDLTQYHWIHFEGRHIPETYKMLAYVKQHHPTIQCSLEVEKNREGIERLFSYADILFFSANYVSQQQTTISSFLQHINECYAIPATCTHGAQGAWASDKLGHIHHVSPPDLSHPVVDSIGAGDTFNAAMIDRLIRGDSMATALSRASQLATQKCQQYGFQQLLTPSQVND